MSCCKTARGPRLGYSVVSETTNCFDKATNIVESISKAGFCAVTIVPEHPVWATVGNPAKKTLEGRTVENIVSIEIIKDDPTASPNHYHFTPPVKKSGSGPDGTKELIRAAIRKGMCVQIMPHLDAIGTVKPHEGKYSPLPGMPWRAHFLFDPMSAAYKDQVILPLLQVVIEALRETSVEGDDKCKPCVAFVLGSEVEMSLAAYASRWSELLGVARAIVRDGLPAEDQRRIEFGHKINHDFAASAERWINIWNQLHGGGTANPAAAKSAVVKYLSSLDFVSVSYYPDLSAVTGWDKAQTPAGIGALAGEMRRQWRKIRQEFNQLVPQPPGGKRPCLEIGEAGIGWIHPEHPAKDVPLFEGFPDCRPGKGINKHLRQYKRIKYNYFAALLKFLETWPTEFSSTSCKANCLKDFRHLTLWNNHWQFDLLGLKLGKYNKPTGKYSRERGRELKKKFHDGKLDRGVLELLKLYGPSLFQEPVERSPLDDSINRHRTAFLFGIPENNFTVAFVGMFTTIIDRFTGLIAPPKTIDQNEFSSAPEFTRQVFVFSEPSDSG